MPPRHLPLLEGPDARVADVVALYNEASELFARQSLRVASLALDARGSWSLALSDGSQVVVGKSEARLRLQRFARLLPQLRAQKQTPLARADLRYTNGFALVWKEQGPGVRGKGPATAAWNRGPQPSRLKAASRFHEADTPALVTQVPAFHPLAPGPRPLAPSYPSGPST